MSETYKKITKDGYKVQVESAIRDGEGVKISTNYAKKTEIPTVPTNVSSFTNDAGYLTQHQDISGKEDSSNKVTSISSSSTDTEYPSAKCVYDEIQDVVEIAEGKTANYVISDATTGTNVVNTSFNSIQDTVAITITSNKIIDVEGNNINLSDLKIGDIVSITETDVPDRWVGSIASSTITFYKLETKLNIDTNPTSGSTNAVSSGGVYTALAGKVSSNTTITGATKTKITYDSKGLVTAGADLQASDIPSLTLSKISDAGTAASKNTGTTSGTIPILGTDGKLPSSIIPAPNIPSKNYVISCTEYTNSDFNTSIDILILHYASLQIIDVEGNVYNLSDLEVGDTITVVENVPNRYVSGKGAENMTLEAIETLPRTTTAGQVLTSTGTSGEVIWATPSSGSQTDVKVNGTSIVSDNVANIQTNSAYDASTNKIATMSDVPNVPTTSTAGQILRSTSTLGSPEWASSNTVALNSTKSNVVDYVKEYWVNSDGTSWYRLWASGWKECGGKTTMSQDTTKNITLPITFSNNEYVVASTTRTTSGGNQYLGGHAVYGRTTVSGQSRLTLQDCDYGHDVLYYCAGY